MPASDVNPADKDHDLQGKRFHAMTVEDLEELGADRDIFTITKDKAQRLDRMITDRLKGVSRNQVQRLLDIGAITVNGRTPKASAKLKEGDEVCIIIPPKPSADILPEEIPLEILYEDDGFIAINKPRDIIVHPARSNLTGTMVNALAWHFEKHPGQQVPVEHPGRVCTTDPAFDKPAAQASGLSGVGKDEARPGVIHRLDKDTTGVILFGKQEESHWKIATQFEFRKNTKAYLAVVHGCPEPLSGAIEEPLGKHPTIREAQCVRHDSQGKPSLTLYRVRERYKDYSLVELDLKTGRTHQIRVHLSYIGHPIVGDIVYGGEPVGEYELDHPPHAAAARPFVTFARTKEEGLRAKQAVAERNDTTNHPQGAVLMDTPALHAGYLKIAHPLRGQTMIFTAPLHDPMLTLVHELRKRPHPEGLQGMDAGTYIDLNKAIPHPHT